MHVAVMDDWQGVARGAADWSAVEARAGVAIFAEPFASEDAAAAALAKFEILVPMREPRRHGEFARHGLTTRRRRGRMRG